MLAQYLDDLEHGRTPEWEKTTKETTKCTKDYKYNKKIILDDHKVCPISMLSITEKNVIITLSIIICPVRVSR